MKRTTSFLVRVALMAAALALAVVFVGREASSPAEATTFNPSFNVSVSDPTPGANADLIIQFSVDKPDSFPNVRTNSSIQFLPRQWGVHTEAPIGSIAGTFNAYTTVGIMGTTCNNSILVPFTMMEASTDTSDLTSALDLAGDLHPGGVGYSGQFVDDPDTVQTPSDLGLPLRGFNANERHTTPGGWPGLPYEQGELVYRDVDNSGKVSPGDIRLTRVSYGLNLWYPVGSVVQAGDYDLLGGGLPIWPFFANEKHDNADGNGQMDTGENIYKDVDWSGTVSYGDLRLFYFAQLEWGSTVGPFHLPAGVTRYPDFLNQVFDPAVVGDPLARMFGAQQVITTAVSLNIVTYRPGQLAPLDARLDASLGYPNVVVILNPVAPVEVSSINTTNDLCTPLTLTSTNFGVSQDNVTTLPNEAGYVRLTNPVGPGEKPHVFTLVTYSQPDADSDGIENMLDSCPFDPNISFNGHDPVGVNDIDFLDTACDPVEIPPSDLGRPLIPFNANELRNGSGWSFAPGSGFTQAIYRDLDASLTVSAGDLRLTQWRTPGNVNYRAAGTTVAPGDEEVGQSLRAMAANEKHDETVAANGRMDPGEGVYRDGNGDGTVSVGGMGDFRQFTFESIPPGSTVRYLGKSPMNPSMGVPDEDLDFYGNMADNCPLAANGIEVFDYGYVQVSSFVFYYGITGDLIGPSDQTDTDGDDIGDACEGSEGGAQCLNAIDDDGDGFVNDGCAPHEDPAFRESDTQCANADDDDGDGVVNDGCPPLGPFSNYPEMGSECDNADDDDGDGWVNDGCPLVNGNPPEQCDNAIDEDLDGRVNDGCPAVDPDDVAKNTITGHMHEKWLTQAVPIAKHGIKLNNLAGPKTLNSPGARTYSVDVSNLSGTESEDIQVALQVAQGCATVSGPSSVSVGPGGSDTASFTVDWTGCPPGKYLLEADACDAGDPAPAGFFASGACPGVDDGKVDTNTLDDAPRSKMVTVGS